MDSSALSFLCLLLAFVSMYRIFAVDFSALHARKMVRAFLHRHEKNLICQRKKKYSQKKMSPLPSRMISNRLCILSVDVDQMNIIDEWQQEQKRAKYCQKQNHVNLMHKNREHLIHSALWIRCSRFLCMRLTWFYFWQYFALFCSYYHSSIIFI